MVDKMCAAWNLPLTEVGIGFRFIAPELMKPGSLYGAEGERVHRVCRAHSRTRWAGGGVVSWWRCWRRKEISVNKIWAKLEKEFIGPHRYSRYDAHYPLEKRATLMERLKANPPQKLLRSPLKNVDARDGVKFVAQDSTWLMLRGSGTEPVLRIYAEGKSDADAQKLLKLGIGLLQD